MTPPYYLAATSDQRFWQKFWAMTRPERWGCIEWRGALNQGYGFTSHGGHNLVAHRIAWMMVADGPVPDGMVVDHLCCFKACVNPDHLEPVTSAENTARFARGMDGWTPVGVGVRRVRDSEMWMYTASGRLRQTKAA